MAESNCRSLGSGGRSRRPRSAGSGTDNVSCPNRLSLPACDVPESLERPGSEYGSPEDEQVEESHERVPVSYLEHPEYAVGVSTARPVKAETFCECLRRGKEKDCKCGEENGYFEWVWDDATKSSASSLREEHKEVLFHVDYSCGTAAVRGSAPMKDDQYFWEVKMTTPVYGTDMMVGIGTTEIDLDRYRHMFCSLIGRDDESWGLSYTGLLHHKGHKRHYSAKFGQGSIIGVHLDMWHGTLSFFKNRKPLGVAYKGLCGKTLFPMVSSTAARSGMKVITSRSFRTSLQFMCCQLLRKLIPEHLGVLEVLQLPPGLQAFLKNNMGWLLSTCMSSPPTANGGLKRSHDEVEMDEDKFKDESQRWKHLRASGPDL